MNIVYLKSKIKANSKNTFALILSTILSFNFLFSQVNSNHVKVNGYHRSNGTYVEPHYRTAPNSTNMDNFSTSGNINPYTNEIGTIPKDNNINYGINNVSYNAVYFPSNKTNYNFERDLKFKSISTIDYTQYSSQFKFYDKLSITSKKELEALLLIKGYEISSVDGFIDISTIEAVYSFQSQNGLTYDGMAGSQTIALLKKLVLKK